MARTRMEWDWVGDYPIFVYTTFIDHNRFDVKVVKGEKGNQNAKGYGPSSKAWMSYTMKGIASRDQVCNKAFQLAAEKLDIKR